MDKAELYQVHYGWIEACEDSDELTEWEADFVESIKNHLTSKGSLTPRQAEILENIYAKKTK